MIDFLVAIEEWLKNQPKLRRFVVCNCGYSRNGEVGLMLDKDVAHTCSLHVDGTVGASIDLVKLSLADPEYFNKLHRLLCNVIDFGVLSPRREKVS